MKLDENQSYQEGVSILGKTDKIVGIVKNSINSTFDSKDPKEIYERLKSQNNPKVASKEQIIRLYSELFLHEKFLSFRKWPIFAEAFNEVKGNVEKFGFKLPLSYYTLIKILGGNYKISTTKKYVLDLINKKD